MNIKCCTKGCFLFEAPLHWHCILLQVAKVSAGTKPDTMFFNGYLEWGQIQRRMSTCMWDGEAVVVAKSVFIITCSLHLCPHLGCPVYHYPLGFSLSVFSCELTFIGNLKRICLDSVWQERWMLHNTCPVLLPSAQMTKTSCRCASNILNAIS